MGRPLSFDQLLPNTLKEFGMEKKAKSYSVLTNWSEIVGEQVAAVTVAESVERGVLNVRVTNTVWRYELTMRKREILSKLAKAYGADEITDIRWK
jgi:predicted nucleic acid-binding Zn ribbon protein